MGAISLKETLPSAEESLQPAPPNTSPADQEANQIQDGLTHQGNHRLEFTSDEHGC